MTDPFLTLGPETRRVYLSHADGCVWVEIAGLNRRLDPDDVRRLSEWLTGVGETGQDDAAVPLEKVMAMRDTFFRNSARGMDVEFSLGPVNVSEGYTKPTPMTDAARARAITDYKRIVLSRWPDAELKPVDGKWYISRPGSGGLLSASGAVFLTEDEAWHSAWLGWVKIPEPGFGDYRDPELCIDFSSCRLAVLRRFPDAKACPVGVHWCISDRRTGRVISNPEQIFETEVKAWLSAFRGL